MSINMQIRPGPGQQKNKVIGPGRAGPKFRRVGLGLAEKFWPVQDSSGAFCRLLCSDFFVLLAES